MQCRSGSKWRRVGSVLPPLVLVCYVLVRSSVLDRLGAKTTTQTLTMATLPPLSSRVAAPFDARRAEQNISAFVRKAAKIEKQAVRHRARAQVKPTWLRLPLPRADYPPVFPAAFGRMGPRDAAKSYGSHRSEAEERRDHNLYHHGTGITVEAKHQAIVGCLVAFSRFMRRKFPPSADPDGQGQWWLDAGTLIGAQRSRGFISWDEDADVQITRTSWDAVLQYMRNQSTYGHLPVQRPAGACGCMLVDQTSFPTRRLPSWPKLKTREMRKTSSGQPGRVVNECTGNFVDIFVATKQATRRSRGDVGSSGHLSSSPTWASSCLTFCKGLKSEWCAKPRFPKAIIFPLKPCTFDRHEMLCPNNVSAYLATVYPNDVDLMTPDHTWNSTLERFQGV